VDGVVLRCNDLRGSTRGGLTCCSLFPLLLEFLVCWGIKPLVCAVGVLGFKEESEKGSKRRLLEQINCMLIIAALILRQ